MQAYHPSRLARFRRSSAPGIVALIVTALFLAGCMAAEPTVTPATPVPAPRPQTPVPTAAATVVGRPTTAVENINRPVGPQENAQAPDFTVVDLNGQKLRLSDFRGKRVLLNFWATWCPPCRAELPQLQAAHVKYGKDEFVVLGVDFGESKDQVSKFAKENGLTYLLTLDETGEALKAYNVRGIPASFFIDRQGVIVMKQAGAVTTAVIESGLKRMP
jgi:peroxiredoxin